MPIRKLITATVIAAAIALSGIASPAAAATNQDMRRLLAGAAGIAALAVILNAGKRNQAQAQPRPQPQHPGHGRPHQAYVLPDHCASEERTHRGWETFYTPHCLQRAGLNRLPNNCEVRISSSRERGRAMYDGACLERAGYQPERRSRR